MSGALTGDVASVGSPLPGTGVLGLHDSHRTPLAVMASAPRPRTRASSSRPALAAPAHAGVMHQGLVG
jgi:hypothetical protein